MGSFKLEWKIEKKYAGMLIREFLLKEKGISKRALADIKFQGGDIVLNGNHVTVRQSIQAGDCLVVQFPPEDRNLGIIAENIPLHIVYEDEYLLIINKPPYMASIPSREHQSRTVANALMNYYDQIGLSSTVHIVNRLDKDTSGLMIIAKNSFVHSLFSLEQKTKSIHREYEAIVHDVVADDFGTINAPIGRKENSIIERTVRNDGQHAVTHYEVKKRFIDRTLVSLKLETGRTHQIRVHMAYIGHPLVGDDLYGGKKDLIVRQALHSKSVMFYHPLLEKELEFTVPLPEDMERLIK
ncbi:MAG TPA: RluA family pseudouridine synthase [Bacillus bacterium]|nr:RluA family pseudouridine synthase [Bacillus sp. (in: firmicutes)]